MNLQTSSDSKNAMVLYKVIEYLFVTYAYSPVYFESSLEWLYYPMQWNAV